MSRFEKFVVILAPLVITSSWMIAWWYLDIINPAIDLAIAFFGGIYLEELCHRVISPLLFRLLNEGSS